MLNLDPPPGFHGLDPDKPIHYYFRKLPHWRQDGATYFVTFRLGDSLPQTKLEELRIFREQFHLEFGAEPSRDNAEKLAKEVMARVEKWLDQGIGECHLRMPQLSNEIASALNFFRRSALRTGLFCRDAEPHPCNREADCSCRISVGEDFTKLETPFSKPDQ